MPRLRARAAATTADGAALPACWVNGAYLVGARLGAAFLGDGLGSTVGDAEGVAGFGSAECPIDVEEALEVVRHGILPLVTASQGAPVSPGPSALAAGLPALMVRCRFAHYVAMVGRERMRGGDIEGRAGLKVAIDEWFSSYLKPDAQFRRPLYQAKVAVRPDLKNPELCVAAVEFRLWPPGGEISDVMRIAVALPAPE